MATPTNDETISYTGAEFKVTPSYGGVLVENNAMVEVHKLYTAGRVPAPGPNDQSDVLRLNKWGIYDDPEGIDYEESLVANVYGTHTRASDGKWSNWFTIEFLDQRFKGSTLQVMGANGEKESSDWSIVGGTGKFKMARGTVKRNRVRGTQALTLEFLCCMPAKEVVPPGIPGRSTKRGPWGGSTGTLEDVPFRSRRLESITIYHHGAVEGFQFSYVDEVGEISTTGLCGQSRNLYRDEIKFSPSEIVKEISGGARAGSPSWLSQFKIITNIRTYGPYGFDNGAQPFSYTVPENEIVVGFFAEVNYLITRIGVRTIPK